MGVKKEERHCIHGEGSWTFGGPVSYNQLHCCFCGRGQMESATESVWRFGTHGPFDSSGYKSQSVKVDFKGTFKTEQCPVRSNPKRHITFD